MGNHSVKRLFISDIHMGDSRSAKLAPGNPYAWFIDNEKFSRDAEQNRPALLSELLTHAIDEGYREVVILGDLFDEWVVPGDMSPMEPGIEKKQFQAILNAPQNQPVLNALESLQNQTALTLVPGNHDMLLTRNINEITAVLPGVNILGKDGLGIYQKGGIWAEHGHQYCMFCSPWFPRNPSTPFDQSLLPLGFFISRVAAQFMNKRGNNYSVFNFVKDLFKGVLKTKASGLDAKDLETIDMDTLIFDAFETMMKDSANQDLADGFIMDQIDGIAESLKKETIHARYGSMFKNWKKYHPENMNPFEAILNETGDLTRAAEFVFEKYQAKIVIFGHTHNRRIKGYKKKDKQLSESRANAVDHVYANTGAWINDKPCSLVETEFFPDCGIHTITLYDYSMQGKKIIGKSCSVL